MPASDVICAIAFTIASSLPPSTVVHSACAVSPAASAAFPSLAIRHTATTGPAYPSSRSSNACTPVMDASIFQGMRTLSANIAVEMPESEVGSTHFRLLFLAGLVLFIFTFLFNTLAEVVRQRLRRKYASI